MTVNSMKCLEKISRTKLTMGNSLANTSILIYLHIPHETLNLQYIQKEILRIF